MSNIIQTTSPITQTQAYEAMKPTYGFISTENLLNQLSTTGWNIASETVAKVRTPGKDGYQKHLLRLRNDDYNEISINGDTVRPELVVLNSHDGSTSTRLFLGILRMACLNGIISGTSFQDVRVIHSKNFTKKLDMGVELVTGNVQGLIETVAALSSKTFSKAALEEFTRSVVDYKLRNVSDLVRVNYDTAIAPRRYADHRDDAWTVLNRVQESLLRGGIYYTHTQMVYDINPVTKQRVVVGTEERTRKTSAVRSITQTVNLNRMVFDKALELAA